MQEPYQEDEINLLDIFQTLWKRRWLIAGMTLAGLVAALSISLVLPKVYRGEVILEVGQIYNSERGANQDKFEPIEKPETVKAVLESDGMAAKLKQVIGYSGTSKGLQDALDVDIESNPLVILKLELQDRQAIQKGLTFLAEEVIQGQSTQYESLKRVMEVEQRATDAQSRQLSKKIKDNEEKQKKISEKLKNLESKMANIREQIEADRAYQQQVKRQVETAQATIRETQSRMAKLEKKQTSPLDILFLQTSLQNAQNQLNNLQAEVHRVGMDLTNRKNSIATTQMQKGDLRVQILSLSGQNADLQKSIEGLKNHKAVMHHILERSHKTQYRNAPMVGEQPVSPRVKLNTAVGGALTFFFSVMLAFFLEYLERRKDEGTVEHRPSG